MTRPKRILFASAGIGGGHNSAAKALVAAAVEAYPQAELLFLDLLEGASVVFNQVYKRGYLDLVKHAPHVLGWLYEQSDRPHRNRVQKFFELTHSRDFRRTARAFNPDLMISTHFTTSALLNHEQKSGKIKAH